MIKLYENGIKNTKYAIFYINADVAETTLLLLIGPDRAVARIVLKSVGDT